jgi:hypothetical protein
MISATVCACALSLVDRSVISCPAAPRFKDALKVANRTVCASTACADSTAAAIAGAIHLQRRFNGYLLLTKQKPLPSDQTAFRRIIGDVCQEAINTTLRIA